MRHLGGFDPVTVGSRIRGAYDDSCTCAECDKSTGSQLREENACNCPEILFLGFSYSTLARHRSTSLPWPMLSASHKRPSFSLVCTKLPSKSQSWSGNYCLHPRPNQIARSVHRQYQWMNMNAPLSRPREPRMHQDGPRYNRMSIPTLDVHGAH